MKNEKISMAKIMWRADVGSLQSRCSIIIEGDHIYIGTCGQIWNVSDARDGIHCFDLHTGNEEWFTPTWSDVNEIAIAGTDIIAPTDAGKVFVLDRLSGAIRYVVEADSAVFGKPLVSMRSNGWHAIVASLSGNIYQMESGFPELVALGNVGASIRATLVPLIAGEFLASGENGTLYRCQVSLDGFISRPIVTLPKSEFGGSPSIYAAPLIVGNFAFLGYIRDTYYNSPALVCVDLTKENILWLASEGEQSFGNVRQTPVMIDGVLTVASAYTDSVHFVDPKTGELLGKVLLGQNVFQQWSAPVSLGDHMVALGRVDGVCSLVDTRRQCLVTSISIATAATEQPDSRTKNSYKAENFDLYPGDPAPEGAICATPAFDGKNLAIGTTDGNLFLIRVDTKS